MFSSVSSILVMTYCPSTSDREDVPTPRDIKCCRSCELSLSSKHTPSKQNYDGMRPCRLVQKRRQPFACLLLRHTPQKKVTKS